MHCVLRLGSTHRPAPKAMGNTVSTKPALPALNVSKIKHSQDTPDELYVGSGHPQRNVVHLSARLPGTARKLPPTAAQQQQQHLVSPQVQEPSGSGMDHSAPHRVVANNIVAKPQVPALNMGRNDSSFPGGSMVGSDQSLTARAAGSSSSSLPQVQAHQAPQTSRAALATSSSQQASSTATDTVRTAPATGEAGPITPAQALKCYSEYLTAFEQSEVLQYGKVWFLGKADAQKVRGNPHLQKTNFGYDDERGDYHVVPSDHIAYRYEVCSVLGKGSFGQVLKVLDYKTGTWKALKIIRNKKRFHHQAQVELKVLQHLRHHDPEAAHNVIHIQEHFMFRNHLCITFELLHINLYEFIKQTNFQGLSLPLIKRFAQQMLVSLKFMRRHQLIHCDLKPENILLVQPQRSAIKVIDFGSSCFVDERMYTYVQSRFYRSPEVILGLPYGCEIDMWSFGCILAELYMGYPLFPGEDEVEQLLCIMEIMGVPAPHLVDAASRKKVFFDASGQPSVVPNSRGKMRHPGTKSLWGVLRCKEPGFVDLLECCLRWDPAERLTPEQAMSHPWILEPLVQQSGSSTTQRPPAASNRSRTDQQAPAAPLAGGLLQPSSMLAAASAALAAAAAGFTGAPVASSASTGKPAADTLAGANSGAAAATSAGTPGKLCSGEPGSSNVLEPRKPSQQQQASGIAPAVTAADAGTAAAAASWQQQLEGLHQGISASGGLPAVHTLQQHRSSGGNDTIQSGIDSTPRSLHVAGSGGSISAAAPSVLVATAAAGVGGLASAVAMVAGRGGVANGGSVGTPHAMDTDAPGGLPNGLTGVKAALLSSLGGISSPSAATRGAVAIVANGTAAAMAHQQQHPPQQQPQQQHGTALISQHRHSSGGLDVLATGGMQRQADQAALVAAHGMVKSMQAGTTAAAGGSVALPAAAGGGSAAGGQYMAQQRKQQTTQQQHLHVIDAATWAEQQAKQQDNSSSTGLMQQQQIALFLQQQQQQQQLLDMSVVGQGLSMGHRQH